MSDYKSNYFDVSGYINELDGTLSTINSLKLSIEESSQNAANSSQTSITGPFDMTKMEEAIKKYNELLDYLTVYQNGTSNNNNYKPPVDPYQDTSSKSTDNGSSYKSTDNTSVSSNSEDNSDTKKDNSDTKKDNSDTIKDNSNDKNSSVKTENENSIDANKNTENNNTSDSTSESKTDSSSTDSSSSASQKSNTSQTPSSTILTPKNNSNSSSSEQVHTGGGYSSSSGYTGTGDYNSDTSNATPSTPSTPETMAPGNTSKLSDEELTSIKNVIDNSKIHTTTIPKSNTPISSDTKSGGGGSSVIPISAGLTAAAAAGLGAKAYLDRKNNNDNGSSDEINTDEWTGDESVDIKYDDSSDNQEGNTLDADDDYSYQPAEETEKYDAKANNELMDLQ